MQAKLFYGVLGAFALGVGVQTVYEWTLPSVVWLLSISFVMALMWRRTDLSHLLFISVFLVSCSLGMIRSEFASWQFGNSSLEQQVGKTIELTGVVVSEPDYRERTVQLHVESGVDKILVTTDRLNKVFYGDKVSVSGKLEQPDVFTTDYGRTFNYPKYLQVRGIEYQVTFAEIEVIGSGFGNVFLEQVLKVKRFFIKSIQSIIPEPAVGLGSGLLLGVKSALGEDIENDFRRTGIIHIVVLSGYNVMLVVAFMLFCFSFVLPLRWQVLAGVLAVAIFALLVGLSATVVRASIMASLVLLARYFGREYQVLRALLLAGTIMLLINPYLLVYDIGFQLSFMATIGLILIIPHFESTAMGQSRGLGLREFFLATIATQIAVLPLLLYHIGEVSLVAVIVNVLVLPVVPLVMLLTFITGVVGFVSASLASLVGFLATFFLNYILFVAEWFSSLSFAAVAVPQFSAGGVFLLYAVLAAAWYWLKIHQHSNELTGWTIETEIDPGVPIKQGSEDSQSVSEKMPVFFR